MELALPDAKNGTQMLMNVDGDPMLISRAFVQFDVSSIPKGATVGHATLKLCLVANLAPGRIHELRLVTSAWTETGVTWNNQPTVSATVTDSITVPSTSQCVSFTVTADVQAWVDGAPNYGWRLADQDELTLGIYLTAYGAREYGAPGQRPNLNVPYSSP